MSDGSAGTPSAAPCAAVLAAHGVFLAACGCYGAHSHGWAKPAMHSAYAGLGGMAALGVCALLTASGVKKLYMIGVHLALLLQAVFCFVFCLQAYKSHADPAKADRFALFVLMGAGSVAGLGLMVVLKPKKKKKDAP
mmetsp:Transcript_23260/g.65071  ORF Transcript_23260/g.65071 Transcript_23260/m.65071 type:complete len:137 (+) Transcript_23260:69-479(+)